MDRIDNSKTDERTKRYNALFEIIADAELAARNGLWWAAFSKLKQAAKLA
jgi:hypothetical protein